MLRSLVSYAATRVAGDAVDDIARRAVWGALAAVLLLTAFIFSVLIVFWHFEPIYGSVPVAAAMAASCLVAALLALSIPAVANWMRKRAEARRLRNLSPVDEATEVVREETEAAVDYFGAVQVVASAFLFGLGAARKIRAR